MGSDPLSIKGSLKDFGLKTKITFLIILIVAGVLLLSSYLDYHFAKKDQIDLYLNRNLYIAKQIDVVDPRSNDSMENLPRIRDEVEEWLLSRPSLMEIDVFLFSAKGWELIVSNSKGHPSDPIDLIQRSNQSI